MIRMPTLEKRFSPNLGPFFMGTNPEPGGTAICATGWFFFNILEAFY